MRNVDTNGVIIEAEKMQAYMVYLKQLQNKYGAMAEYPIEAFSKMIAKQGISIEFALKLKESERKEISPNEYQDIKGVGNLISSLMKEKQALKNRKKHAAAYSFFGAIDSEEKLREPHFLASLPSDRDSPVDPQLLDSLQPSSERRPLNRTGESPLATAIKNKKRLPFNLRDGTSPIDLKEEIGEFKSDSSKNKSRGRSKSNRRQQDSTDYQRELEQYRKKTGLSPQTFDAELNQMRDFLDRGTIRSQNDRNCF